SEVPECRGPGVRMSRVYSTRRASVGSRPMARRAGTMAASAITTTAAAAATTVVDHDPTSTAYTSDSIVPDSQRPATTPTTAPVAAAHTTSRTTSQRT